MRTRLALLLLCACTIARGQWIEAAWQRDNSYRATQTFWATSHSIIYTQHLGTNWIVSTNSFLYNIAPTNFTDYPVANTFKFTIADISDTGNPSNQMYIVTETNLLAQTNLFLNWRSQIKWDCTMATLERIKGGGSSSNVAAGVRFYADDRQQIAYLKGELEDSLSQKFWINPIVASNYLASSNFLRTADYNEHWLKFNGLATYTNKLSFLEILANTGTNFLSYTPYSDLFYTNSYYKRVMTCAVFIVTSSTNIITNMVKDCCGGTYQAIGTNGQRIVNICTNTYIDPGQDASYYGYYAYRRVITNMKARAIQSSKSFHDWFAYHDSTNKLYDYSKGVAFTNHLNSVDDAWYLALMFGEQVIAVESLPGYTDGYTNSTAIIYGGGTNLFSFASPPYGVSAKIDVLAAGQLGVAPGMGKTNNAYFSFRTGIQQGDQYAPPIYLTFTETNWDGVISVTNTPAMSDWPTLIVSGTNINTIYSDATVGYNMDGGMSSLIWFYGVSTNAPHAFKYR